MARKRIVKNHRKAGEPLPNVITTNIVVQAIAPHMSVAEFTAAYDAVPRKRLHDGPRPMPATVLKAIVAYGEHGDFDRCVRESGKGEATVEKYLGRLTRL
jgi:hypothetical protein